MTAKKVRHFFPCNIFRPGTQTLYRLVPEAGGYVAVCPASTSLGRAESHFWWGEDSNLCCHCSRWDPAGCQMEPAASRAIASRSCKLLLVFVRGKAGTLGLQLFLSITRAIYCWEGRTAARQQLQPGFSSERATNSCCAGRRVVASLRSSCWSTAIFTGLCHWGMGLTTFEDLRNQQRSQKPFPDWESARPAPVPSSCRIWSSAAAPLLKRQKQPLLQSSSFMSSVLLSSAVAQLSSEP